MSDDEDDKIRKDINHWVDSRLKQWYKDSMMRYEVTDCSARDANAEVMLIIFRAMATMIAATTDLTAREAGEHLEDMIKSVRYKLALLKKQRHQSS